MRGSFLKFLKNRRSIRNFQPWAVSPEIIDTLIKDSTLAPNTGNEQRWKFVVIHNQSLIKMISDESKMNLLKMTATQPECFAGKYKSLLENESFNVFYNAPCLILILGPRDEGRGRSINIDCALAASYMMFSAVEGG